MLLFDLSSLTSGHNIYNKLSWFTAGGLASCHYVVCASTGVCNSSTETSESLLSPPYSPTHSAPKKETNITHVQTHPHMHATAHPPTHPHNTRGKRQMEFCFVMGMFKHISLICNVSTFTTCCRSGLSHRCARHQTGSWEQALRQPAPQTPS